MPGPRAHPSAPLVLLALAAGWVLPSAPCAGQSIVAPQPGAPSTMAAALAEANRDFTFAGEPINPRAVHDLLPWRSDALPGPVAVDVEGARRSRRYAGEVEHGESGAVRALVETRPGQRAEVYEYVRLGTLPGGLHVLRVTARGTSASDGFVALLVIRFSIEREYQDEEWRARLVMTRVAEVSLPDRYEGDITVSSRGIAIGADRRSGTKARTVRF